MLERFFELKRHGTTVRTELLAGVTTFLTMAYIIFVQPAVLSGSFFAGKNVQTGLDFGAVAAATCVAAALATAIMGVLARYPIALAPGMGENFVFVLSLLPAAQAMLQAEGVADTTPWQVGLGVIFYSGVLFMLLSLLGIRELILNAISPNMRNAIAIGIGLFIALIGVNTAGLVHGNSPPDPPITLNPHFDSPDLIVFFFGLFLTAVLFARRVRGAIVLGILGAAAMAVALRFGLPHLPEAISQSALVTNSKLMTQFQVADHVVARPPSMAPTFMKMDLIHSLSWQMAPFILIFLFMDVFDTLGTLVGVSEQAGLIRDGKLPRAKQAMISDAVGTVAGAALGTSTVTSFVESAAGVEQGGRTGLTALTVAAMFLLALFFSPVIAMVGSYPAVTAPALVVVGMMMMRNATKIEWANFAESLPCFLVILGIPLTYSIPDGLGLGLIAYPVVKLAAGQRRDVKWPMYVLAVLMVAYFIFVRTQVG